MMIFILRTVALYAALLMGFGMEVKGARNVADFLAWINLAVALWAADDIAIAVLVYLDEALVPPGLALLIDIAAALVLVWHGHWWPAFAMGGAAALWFTIAARCDELRKNDAVES